MIKLGQIEFPGAMPSQNKMRALGVHAERRAKKRWREDAFLLALSEFPAALRYVEHEKPNLPRVKRKVVITSYRNRLVDSTAESLAGGALKHVIDGMVDAGVFAEDSQKWLTREYRQVQDKNERTTLEVWG